MDQDRDLCGNCGRWREEHYAGGGIFIADRYDENPCFEYNGTTPTEERRASKADELRQLREARNTR